MANNYVQSSSFIPFAPEQKAAAYAIIERAKAEILEEFDEPAEFSATVDDDGVWFSDDGEWVNPEHLERAVRSLVNGLWLEGVFVCSWACTCSKKRIDEFGGGAFAVARGMDAVWIDAATEAERQMKAAIVRIAAGGAS
jgi:hypothetical protein